MYFNIYVSVTEKNGLSLFGFDVFDSCGSPGCTLYLISALLLKYSLKSTLKILRCTRLKWASYSSKWAGIATYVIKQGEDKATQISRLLSGFTGLSLK